MKLLIINKTQFGYHTDYYKYCEHLRDEFDVTYLCFDSGFKKLAMDKVNLTYVSTNGIRFVRGIRFILTALFAINRLEGIVFIHYFENCKFLKKIFPKKRMILDIRTLSISPNEKIRHYQDLKIKEATKCFDTVTIISDGLRKKIKLNFDKSAILPLGADIFSITNKNFNKSINLLYVGTLNGRNIHHTIIGLSKFHNQNSTQIEITYDIIGDGVELDNLKELVIKLNLKNIVKIHGRIPHFELKPFFDNCNVGISYIPKTEYYNFQPATKTYEYILSGIPCIATNTYENEKIINKTNGVICKDNPESFNIALKQIIGNFKHYNSEEIRQTLIEFTWAKITQKHLIPILNK